MDAVEYLIKREKMCEIPCSECGLNYDNNGEQIHCEEFERMYPEKAVKIVEKWAKVGNWIPCSERLPISGIDVEVTTEDGERKIGHHIGGLWYESIYTTCISVIAWKEPSEPWEEEE